MAFLDVKIYFNAKSYFDVKRFNYKLNLLDSLSTCKLKSVRWLSFCIDSSIGEEEEKHKISSFCCF